MENDVLRHVAAGLVAVLTICVKYDMIYSHNSLLIVTFLNTDYIWLSITRRLLGILRPFHYRLDIDLG